MKRIQLLQTHAFQMIQLVPTIRAKADVISHRRAAIRAPWPTVTLLPLGCHPPLSKALEREGPAAKLVRDEFTRQPVLRKRFFSSLSPESAVRRMDFNSFINGYLSWLPVEALHVSIVVKRLRAAILIPNLGRAGLIKFFRKIMDQMLYCSQKKVKLRRQLKSCRTFLPNLFQPFLLLPSGDCLQKVLTDLPILKTKRKLKQIKNNRQNFSEDAAVCLSNSHSVECFEVILNVSHNCTQVSTLHFCPSCSDSPSVALDWIHCREEICLVLLKIVISVSLGLKRCDGWSNERRETEG